MGTNEVRPRDRWRGATRKDRIDRLRTRLQQAKQGNEDDPIIPIIAGMLDLLADMDAEDGH